MVSPSQPVEGWRLAHRAWLLEPENPEDISALAKAWMMLGGYDEAEELVLQGLEKSGNNGNLLGTYWNLLVITGRVEEAQSHLQDMVAEIGPNMPPAMKRSFDMQLGMIAAFREHYELAYELLSSAISYDDNPTYVTNDVMVYTMASLMSKVLGKEEEAQQRLEEAERKVIRARINGVDSPEIYYTEAVLLTMRDRVGPALEKLQAAYDRGFREGWMLDIDGRLDPIRDTVEFVDLKNRVDEEIAKALAEVRSSTFAVL